MKRKTVLYLDIADKIKEEIFSGKYPVGSMLPSENELEQAFGVSKITIRKAVEILATDEYVEKKSGKGTTVLSNRPYNKLSKATGFTQLLSNSGHALEKKIISFEKVEIGQDHILYKDFGKEAMLFTRIYLLDNQPYIQLKHYLPIDLVEGDVENNSIYRLLNEKGYQIDQFKDEFVVGKLTKEEQKILETNEEYALRRIRKSLNIHGKIVEYSQGVYNTSLYPYSIEYET